MNVQDKLHLALKKHFRKDWDEDTFDETFVPAFKPNSGYVSGQCIEYRIIDCVRMEFIECLLDFCKDNNACFNINLGVDCSILSWYRFTKFETN